MTGSVPPGLANVAYRVAYNRGVQRQKRAHNSYLHCNNISELVELKNVHNKEKRKKKGTGTVYRDALVQNEGGERDSQVHFIIIHMRIEYAEVLLMFFGYVK